MAAVVARAREDDADGRISRPRHALDESLLLFPSTLSDSYG